jgi:L-lactate dehydrogenase
MREERNSEDVGSPCDHGYPVTVKVSIVGPGRMGMTRAYTLALKGVVHAPLDVRAGHLHDVADSEVVVISASVPMNADLKDPDALAEGNVVLMKTLLPSIAAVAPQAKMTVLSNPMDVLTWQALRLTSFPAERVMVIGTLVDSAYFREGLSRELAIHPDGVRSYVLGGARQHAVSGHEAGPGGGDPIKDTRDRGEFFASTVGAGLEVFKMKGHTSIRLPLRRPRPSRRS